MPTLRDIAPGTRITAISPLPRDPDLRRLQAGRRTIATVRADDVEEMQLTIGTTWTEALAQSVRAAVEKLAVRNAALRLLNHRAYSGGELTERLVRKGHSRHMAAETIQEFATAGFIDDEAYAQALARVTITAKPASCELIVRKLRARQIAPDLAEKVAREVLAGTDPVEAAVRLARKRLPSLARVSRSTAVRRLTGTLARRGFDSDTIGEVLNRINLRGNDPHDSGSNSDDAHESEP